MAGNIGIAQSSQVATGTNPKTILQVAAPANFGLTIKKWGISFAGTSPTAGKIPVDLIRGATGGTAGATPASTKHRGHTGGVQATVKESFSGEPSGGTVIGTYLVHPQSGIVMQDDILLNPGETLGIRTSAPADVNARAQVVFEE